MGLFDGIEDAELFERGKFMKGDFSGTVEVTRTVAKKTRKSGVAFIVELRIITTNLPADHPVGSKATWFQKMSDKDVAFPAIKAWAAAMAGYETHQKEAIEREVSPELSKSLDAATEDPGDNDFIGLWVNLATEMIKTRADRDFTRYVWSPNHDEDETEDEVA